MAKTLAERYSTPQDAGAHFHGIIGPGIPREEMPEKADSRMQERQPPEGATLYTHNICV